MIDVTALGETLIDFTPAGSSAQRNPLFEQNPGGAPANVLTAVTRLGGKAAFISAVGDDAFGHYLIDVVKEIGIDASGVQITKKAATTLAFVCLTEAGDRSFSFCRKPGADQCMELEALDHTLLDDCKIFHFGSLSLCEGTSKEVALHAADYAASHGKLVSYDPNWRPALWDSVEEGIAGMKLGLPYAHIIKLSEEELELLSGTDDLEEGTRRLYKDNARLIVVTLGPDGCFYRCGQHTGKLSTYDTKVVDTTGAGDAFWGALLYQIVQNPVCIDDEDDLYLQRALDFANASGSLCAAGRGAIPSIKGQAEIAQLQKSVPKLIR